MTGASRAFIGGAVWVAAMAFVHPSPLDVAWGHGLLVLAALVLVPIVLDLATREDRGGASRAVAIVQVPTAVLLAVAYFLPQGAVAAGLAVPWLVTTILIAWCGLTRVFRRGPWPLHELCIDVGLLFIAAGGAGALLDRLGSRPLDFEPVLVLLFAIHFHHAGFVLPIVTGLAAREARSWIAVLACIAVVTGVPAVAVGITATQLRLGTWYETIAVWWLALGGVATAVLHVRLALTRAGSPTVRGLWALSGFSLAASMALAAAYGARYLVEVSWLDIPWMRALHGTSNAIGFGLAGTLAWYLWARRSRAGVPSEHGLARCPGAGRRP